MFDSLAPEATGDDLLSSAPTPTPTTESAFARFGLAPALLQAVQGLGFTEPTAVQAAAIPRAMPQRQGEQETWQDLMVSSQTGSGKTAAFLLPVLHGVLAQQQRDLDEADAAAERARAEALARGEAAPKKPKRRFPPVRRIESVHPLALVLCPTRELAQQVAKDAIDLLQHARGLRVATVVGGMPYAVQIQRMQGASLVVATPGRLLDLQRSGQLQMDRIRFLVVDEADRMLDLGFADDLAEIHRLCAARQQTMMFSATFAQRIEQLAGRVMRSPQRLAIAQPTAAENRIRQRLYWADNRVHKRRLLDHWLRDPSIDQAIVFACTQIECDELAADLQDAGFAATALHGALSQGLRNRRLGALRHGEVQFLVATDVAARGIDVPTITHVFNYGLPLKAEDYVHRIGRTGRAGREGLAVTLAEPRDQRRLGEIEQVARPDWRAEVIEGLEPQWRPDTRRAPQRPRAGRPQGDRRGAPPPRGAGADLRRGAPSAHKPAGYANGPRRDAAGPARGGRPGGRRP